MGLVCCSLNNCHISVEIPTNYYFRWLARYPEIHKLSILREALPIGPIIKQICLAVRLAWFLAPQRRLAANNRFWGEIRQSIPGFRRANFPKKVHQSPALNDFRFGPTRSRFTKCAFSHLPTKTILYIIA